MKEPNLHPIEMSSRHLIAAARRDDPAPRHTSGIGFLPVLALLAALVAAGVFYVMYIGSKDLLNSWLLAVPLSLILVLMFRSDPDANPLILAWSCRLIAVLIVWRYATTLVTVPGADWVIYDRSALAVMDVLQSGGGFPGFKLANPLNVSVFAGYVYALLGRSISGPALIESALALFASWAYLKACRLLVANPGWPVRYGLTIFPSVIFWTSSLGKDAFVNLGIALAVYGIVLLGARPGRELAASLWMAVGVLLTLMFRPYVALVLVPSAMAGVAFAIFGRGRRQRVAAIAVLVLGLGLTPVAIRIGTRNFQWRAEEAGSYLAAVGSLRASAGGAGSGLSGFTTPSEFVLTLPAAVATILFRPFIWEAHNAASLVAALDTILLLLFVIALVWLVFRNPRAVWRARRHSGFGFLLVLFCGLVLELSNLAGNFGTMVRARVQLIPAVILLFAVVWSEGQSMAMPALKTGSRQ